MKWYIYHYLHNNLLMSLWKNKNNNLCFENYHGCKILNLLHRFVIVILHGVKFSYHVALKMFCK